MGLIQNSAKGTRSEFGVQWNNTAYRTSLCSTLSTTWLPRCRTRANPSFSRARIAWAP